jgi:4a-hydroxytetrahydrobiopterin dehydratase
VTVRLITIADGYYGLSERDVELTRRISAVARELGTPPDPSAVQSVEIAIDALVRPEVMPFWRAVLGYRDRGDGDDNLIDPRGRGPLFWFSRWTRRACNVTASTSTTGFRMTRPRSGSPPRSRRAACW